MKYLGTKTDENSLATIGDIPKLYTSTGSKTDGTMTQKAITDALSGAGGNKEEIIYYGTVSKDVPIELPVGRKLSDYKYIDIVLCKAQTVSTGNNICMPIRLNADMLADIAYKGENQCYLHIYGIYHGSGLETLSTYAFTYKYDTIDDIRNMTSINMHSNSNFNRAFVTGVIDNANSN